MAKLRVSVGDVREKLAGRVFIHPGRRGGEVVLEVPGEGEVKRHYLECIVDSDSLVVTAAYREDIFGTHEVSLLAVAGWLKQQGVSVEVLRG